MEALKTGDWVRVIPKSRRALINSGTNSFIGTINVIDKNNLYNVKAPNNTDWFELEDILKWVPESGEWCWFWDYLGFTPTIGIYVKRKEENFLADIPNGKGSLTLKNFKYCQPFIGELPSNIKDL